MSFDGRNHFFLLSIHLGMELLSHRVGKCLVLRDAAWLFSREPIPIYTPTSNS